MKGSKLSLVEVGTKAKAVASIVELVGAGLSLFLTIKTIRKTSGDKKERAEENAEEGAKNETVA